MMRGRDTIWSAFATAGLALALVFPSDAQAKSKDKGHQSSPPSSSPLPSLAGGGPTASGASLLAWIDDASVLAPGTMALTISTMRWSGTDLSETDVRAWADDALTGLSRNRGVVSGGASCLLRPQIAVFGSLGRTIATLDADGAGTTLSGGVTFLLTPAVR